MYNISYLTYWLFYNWYWREYLSSLRADPSQGILRGIYISINPSRIIHTAIEPTPDTFHSMSPKLLIIIDHQTMHPTQNSHSWDIVLSRGWDTPCLENEFLGPSRSLSYPVCSWSLHSARPQRFTSLVWFSQVAGPSIADMSFCPGRGRRRLWSCCMVLGLFMGVCMYALLYQSLCLRMSNVL